MIRPEYILIDKIIDGIKVAIDKLITADMEFNNVHEINEKWIKVFKDEYRIEAIIIDLDDTIRKPAKEIPECNVEWIKLMLKNFKIIVLTNGAPGIAEDTLDNLGIDSISLAFKPVKLGFIKACKKLGVSPEHVLVIGDNKFDDIFGAHRNKMMGALVKEVTTDDEER